MKVQAISVLILISFLALLLLLISLFFSSIILTGYGSLEQKFVEKDLDQAVQTFTRELDSIGILATDWAVWDDAALFVSGENPDFIQSNLLPETFDALHINIIVFTNQTGDIIYAGAYDLKEDTPVPIPPPFVSRMDQDHPVMKMSDLHATTGILFIQDTPFLIASHPILRSDLSGDPRGVVIMGRYLTSDEIGRLRLLTRQGLAFTRPGDPAIPPDRLRSGRDRGIETDGPDRITGYAIIRDLFGRDALFLEIRETREISRQGIMTALQVILITLAVGLLAGAGMILLLNHVVLRRINTLAAQVQEVSRSPDQTGRIEIPGDDEISSLAREIRQMLDTITRTRDQLEESETRFRELVESLPDYIILYGDEGRVLYMNPAAAENLGPQPSDRSGRSLLALAESQDTPDGKELNQPSERRDEEPVREMEIRTSDNRIRTVLVKEGRVRYRDGPATVLLLTDITGRRELEKEKERYAAELKDYSESLKKTGRRLGLLSTITRHDILNNTAIIHGFLQLSIQDNTSPDVAEYLEKMMTSIRNIQEQIEFTRIYEEIGTEDPQWIHLSAVMPSSALPQGVQLTTSGEDVCIYADPMLGKVFYNLLDNSIRHGGQVTVIQVHTRRSGDDLVITWEDNGVGIAPEVKEKIFQRGWGNNTGLGMFLIREILALTGISIRETGVWKSGARFEITVPDGGFRTRTGGDENTENQP